MTQVTLQEAVKRVMKAHKCTKAEAESMLEEAMLSGKLRFSATEMDTGRRVIGRIVDGQMREEQ
jgi:hypothetical protein